MTKAITIDTARWPLVSIRFFGAADDATFGGYLAEYDRLLERNERYGILLDALESAAPSARQRSLQAAWMKERQGKLAERCVAGGFAIASPLVRGALTAILWLQPLPFPHSVHATVFDAENWVRSRMKASGLVVP